MGEGARISICIPAYNRPQELGRLLESIARQQWDGIEIVIGDDSTTDAVDRVVKSFQNLPIVYTKNPVRLGFSGNLLAVTRRATGQYIWWMGDDDEIVDGGISHVMSVLGYSPDMVWVNVQATKFPQGYIRNISEGFLAHNEDAFYKIGNLLTFISSMVLRKDFLQLDRPEVAAYHKSEFINFVIVADILARGGRCFVVKYPYVIAWWPQTGESWPLFKVFSTEFLRVMKWCEPYFSLRARRAMIASVFHYCWRGIVLEHVMLHRSPRPFIVPIIKTYWSYPEILIAAPLLVMPYEVVRRLYAIHQRLLYSIK